MPAAALDNVVLYSKGSVGVQPAYADKQARPVIGSPIIVPQANMPALHLVVCHLNHKSIESYWAAVCCLHLSRLSVSLYYFLGTPLWR